MKYFKPKSLTWWTGTAALAGGLLMALGGQIDAFAPVAAILTDLTGISEPYMLITYGLTTVGFRGALK